MNTIGRYNNCRLYKRFVYVVNLIGRVVGSGTCNVRMLHVIFVSIFSVAFRPTLGGYDIDKCEIRRKSLPKCIFFVHFALDVGIIKLKLSFAKTFCVIKLFFLFFPIASNLLSSSPLDLRDLVARAIRGETLNQPDHKIEGTLTSWN